MITQLSGGRYDLCYIEHDGASYFNVVDNLFAVIIDGDDVTVNSLNQPPCIQI